MIAHEYSSSNENVPLIPRHPLDQPSVTKIALSSAASEALAALGPHCLVIATKADCTAPEWAKGRVILLCVPLDTDTARAVESVALGKARAVRDNSQAQGSEPPAQPLSAFFAIRPTGAQPSVLQECLEAGRAAGSKPRQTAVTRIHRRARIRRGRIRAQTGIVTGRRDGWQASSHHARPDNRSATSRALKQKTPRTLSARFHRRAMAAYWQIRDAW